MPSELKKKAVRGAGWLTLGQFANQGMSLVVTGILARLLTPEAFGLVGMVVVFTAFLEMFQELGLSSAVIQKQDSTEEQLSTVFFITVALGALLAALTAAVSPAVAWFYDEPELKTVTTLLGLNFFLNSVVHVPAALLRRELSFGRLVLIGLAANILSAGIAVSLAFGGAGVYALVAKTLSFTLVDGLLVWIVSGWRPRGKPRLKAVRQMFGFGANITASGFLVYVVQNADYLLIGRLLGKGALGYYTLAYRIMRLPMRRLTAQISRVAFPAFSAVQNDIARVRRGFLELTRIIAVMSFPAMCGLILVAPEAIPVLLGEEWRPVIFLVQVLALAGAVSSVTSGSTHLFRSQGRPEILLRFHLVYTPLMVAGFAVGTHWGVRGVAVAYSVLHCALSPVPIILAARLIKLSLRDYIMALRAPIIASAVMMVAVGGFRMIALDVLEVGRAPLLLAEIGLGVVTYLAAMAVVGRTVYAQGWEIAKTALGMSGGE